MLNDKDIKEYIKSNKIKICGFIEDNIGPCSYDVRLGNEIIIYKNEVLDLEIENEYMKYKFNIGDKVLLCPAWKEYSNKEKEKLCKKYNCVEVFDCGILGLTMEHIELPNDICAQYQGRSSYGRLFLTSHQTAGWIDAGFKGKVVLEILAGDRPIILKIGERIGQIIFFKMTEPCNIGYNDRDVSKYKNQNNVIAFIPDR